ncbi:MAG: aspartate aminotransferase family protein, partial [Chitinophagaceae bacterium]|nr:aspartate aminotransferase family protein [Chitinophagaceae bacterium]
MTNDRKAAIEMNREEFRQMGYKLIDSIADFTAGIRERPVTTGENPQQIQDALGTVSLPQYGSNAPALMEKATELMMKHSLLNGHPKFMGYITSSAAPIGALAD